MSTCQRWASRVKVPELDGYAVNRAQMKLSAATRSGGSVIYSDVMHTTVLLHSVAEARARVLDQVRGLSELQAASKPDQTCWSISEIVEHLVLAEASGVTKIWAAAEGVRSGHPVWVGEHTNSGLSIDEVIARTWKEKEVAPSIAAPHIGGPLAYWVESLRLSQPLLDALGVFLEGMDLRTIVYPHFLSGPLDAEQRLEFLRYHMDRHRGQIERTRIQLGLPAA